MKRAVWIFAKSAMLGLTLGILCMLHEEEQHAKGSNFADIEERG
ncbi:hypothetical protein [Hydrogenophaga electricum]|nr:hypothetical protein [Hydrogenophaga electricum]